MGSDSPSLPVLEATGQRQDFARKDCAMIKKKDNAGKYRSRLSAAIHETAAGLHRIRLMNKATMREFDASCLTAVEPLSAKDIIGDPQARWR
jgi:hypothetical protein